MIEYENLNLVNKVYELSFEKAFKKFLNTGWYILGEQVQLFEEEFASFCGSRFCIGLASGLDALYLSLIALDIPKGSEVIVPSNTYIATITSIINSGLKPILVEPVKETCNIDPKLIIEKINNNTKAIIVVHLYGKPCDMQAISNISKKYNIPIIEDCAQAHGAKFANKKVGTWGTFGAFSFYPTKNLGALGDAGAIVTDNEIFATKLKALRNYGSQEKYHNDYVGLNSRLDEIQAAFLRIKLKDLDKINSYKNKLAQIYFDNIRNSLITLPVKHSHTEDAYHIFNIRCSNRNQLKDYLFNHGIKTEIHYPVPPHQQKGYKDMIDQISYPISEEIHRSTLSLPISTANTPKEIMYICGKLNAFNCRQKS